MSTDAELLQRYVRDHDEGAFAELVRRHLPVVYAAAHRRALGRADLAGDAVQQVFCDLARKSVALMHHDSLIGWLYRSARYAVIDALRADVRRQRLLQRAAEEPPLESDGAAPPAWEDLRPWLDAAMDDLRSGDREVVLMRFFYNLSFGEIGQRLGLSENTARMRTERSLERLRTHLARRGLTSTAAALAVALGSEACASAPAGVALAVTRAAVAVAPIGAGAGPVTLLLMSKITVPVVSGLIAAGLTAVVWTATTDGVGADELAALRTEQTRLAQATAPDASPAAVAAVADHYTAQANAIAAAMDQRRTARSGSATGGPAAGSSTTGSPEVTARGHSDHGTATPEDAALTFAWACDIADPDELAKVITFDADGRQAALEALAAMPEGVRALYPTPEAFYGMLLAASCLEAPPPGADMIRSMGMTMVELTPDRYATRRPGSTRNNHEYQRVDGAWKYVLPTGGVRSLPGLLNSETLVRLSKP